MIQTSRMRVLPKACLAAVPLLLSVMACQASVDGDGPPAANGGSTGTAGSSSLAGGVSLPDGVQSQALLPARIRRLTDAEYQATVNSLIGDAADGVSKDFVPDSRQSDFTVNEAQRIDPVFARQLATAAETLAAAFAPQLMQKAPCADPTGGAAACAEQFIASDEINRAPKRLHEAEGAVIELERELTRLGVVNCIAWLS